MDNESAEDPAERRSYYLDIAIAGLLGIAAVATAWCAFQSSLFGGDQATAFNDAAVNSDQAGQWYAEGNQAYTEDLLVFLEYINHIQANDLETAAYLREAVMTERLVRGLEWWEDQGDEGPETPLDDENPEYIIEEYSIANDLDDASVQATEDAAEANDTGDKYDFLTVLFAASLFVLGIAGVFRPLPVKFGMGGLGLILLVVTLILLATLSPHSVTW